MSPKADPAGALREVAAARSGFSWPWRQGHE